jgi:Tfp pilus assembly protein PilX
MKTNYKSNNQDGMALVITLILLLTLSILASSVFMSVNRYAETIDNISYRPMAMEAANSCIDQALDWVSTPEGEIWRNGGVPIDLAAVGNALNKKTVFIDTSQGTREKMFESILGKSSCTKVLITKVSEGVTEKDKAEIGSQSTYGSSDLKKYVLRIEARGVFNVPLNQAGTAIRLDNWNSTSNVVDIEVHVGFEP